MKTFLENPAQLVGAPMLVIGALGLLVAAVTVVFAPAMQTTVAARVPTVRRGVQQPSLEDYAGIVAPILVLTVIEFLLFAFGISYPVFVGILFGMTVVKITLVVMFLFHLKFDSTMFTTTFLASFAAVAAVAVIAVSAIVGSTFV